MISPCWFAHKINRKLFKLTTSAELYALGYTLVGCSFELDNVTSMN